MFHHTKRNEITFRTARNIFRANGSRLSKFWHVFIRMFTLGSHLLGTFVQMIQIIDFVRARVVHFVERFEIVLKITPYALHCAQVQSDRSCEIVLNGSVANPFQTFPFFLPELKIVPFRFLIYRKRHVDDALITYMYILYLLAIFYVVDRIQRAKILCWRLDQTRDDQSLYRDISRRVMKSYEWRCKREKERENDFTLSRPTDLM